MKDENIYYEYDLSMDGLDNRICNAIKRLNWYFGEKNYVICGSVALYIQGVDLGRVPHDFDIFIPDKNRELFLRLFRLIIGQTEWLLDFPRRPLEGKEIIGDFEFQGLNVKCQTAASILECKKLFISDKSLSANEDFYNKQTQDIEKITEFIKSTNYINSNLK